MDVPSLLALRSRGDVKRAGAWLDGPGRTHREALVTAARAAGADLPEDWATLDGKRLLRACLSRAAEAQVLRNPIARDEAFTCVTCGAEVPCGGRRPRDHCPWCLHSRHVDEVPGDRAATCGGVLRPVRVEPSRKGWMIVYRCVTCGTTRRNRVLDDVVPADATEVVRRLLVQPVETG